MNASPRAVIFAGPSLPPSTRPTDPAFEWHPPLRQGELYQAALTRPAIIGITDGYFEVTPTVWHKEILWAMTQGIHVYGSASIGALRAAELHFFGMKGVGRIFEAYRQGILSDDDEVAVLHGPEELDYPAVTEAMVNIRATLDSAVAEACSTAGWSPASPKSARHCSISSGAGMGSSDLLPRVVCRRCRLMSWQSGCGMERSIRSGSMYWKCSR